MGIPFLFTGRRGAPVPPVFRTPRSARLFRVGQRHEPDLGELNHPFLFAELDALGYDGWIGCEYRPRRGAVPGGTTDGLGWAREWLQPRQPS